MLSDEGIAKRAQELDTVVAQLKSREGEVFPSYSTA